MSRAVYTEMVSDDFTLGIEEEFQIIDPDTRDLKSRIAQLIRASVPPDGLELQAELHQSVVEVATPVCADIDEARRAVIRQRRQAADIAGRVGLKIGAASTHAFARWEDQPISDKERYAKLVDDLQDIARANLIFGMHVHVGVTDKDEAIAIFNSARYFLPHLLALSTSSPFFNGRKTGLKSARTQIFKRLPRTGIPERFGSYQEFESFINLLVGTNCIDDGGRIWWDIRPHPRFSTLEFRICDLPPLVDDVVAIAALCQAIVAKLAQLHRRNQSWNVHRTALMQENKWRAARYGVSSPMIDFGRRSEEPFEALMADLLDFVDDVLDDLGSRDAIDRVRRIATEGTSADRQLAVYESSGGSLRAVVDQVLEETMEAI